MNVASSNGQFEGGLREPCATVAPLGGGVWDYLFPEEKQSTQGLTSLPAGIDNENSCGCQVRPASTTRHIAVADDPEVHERMYSGSNTLRSGECEASTAIQYADTERVKVTNGCKEKYRIKVKGAACHGRACCKGT